MLSSSSAFIASAGAILSLVSLVTVDVGHGLSSTQQKFEEYYWGDWTRWSSCDRLCARDKGSQTRIRICFRVANNQRLIGDTRTCEMKLDGSASDENQCYETECDGEGSFTATWSSWEPWICSYHVGICGKGTKTRSRHCTNPDSSSLDGGAIASSRCPGGKAMDEGDCFAKCPDMAINKYGGWSEWSPWKCGRECAPGVTAVRKRACDNPPPVKGYTCPGDKQQIQPCDGLCSKAWADWGPWSSCTKTCDQALRVRKRKCEGFGLPCQGVSNEKSECIDTTTHNLCPPADGGWGVWSHWTTECSVTCGDGVKIRERDCNRPPQAGLGQDCIGATNETKPCITGRVCPVHGEWSDWEWLDCTASCGGGTGNRKRTCSKPLYGGRPCSGPPTEVASCNLYTCPPPTVAPALASKIDSRLLDSEFSFIKDASEMVEMSCNDMTTVHQYYPDATLEWTKNGEDLLMDGLRVRIDRKTLVFEEVTAEDSGVYLCYADYGGRENLVIDVYALAVTSPQAQVFVHEGQDFNLTCNGAELGVLFDGCTQKWFKDERAAISHDKMINVEVFQHADERFGGIYSCVVSHPKTDRQWTTNIVNVTVLPPIGLVDIIWAKAQTNVQVAGGVAGGVAGLLIICCTMCYITCRSSKSKKSSKKPAKETKADEGATADAGENATLYDDGGYDNSYYDNGGNYDNSEYQEYNYDY